MVLQWVPRVPRWPVTEAEVTSLPRNSFRPEMVSQDAQQAESPLLCKVLEGGTSSGQTGRWGLYLSPETLPPSPVGLRFLR